MFFAAPPPTTLANDLAIVYADKLGIVRAGSPIDAEPAFVALPAKVFRPPVWSGKGEVFVGLEHGEIARVDAKGLHVVALAKGVHRMWDPLDELYAAKDGSVWLHACTQHKKPSDDCARWQFVRVDAPDKPAAKGHAPRPEISWPKVAPPSGHTVRNAGENGVPRLICETAPPGSPYAITTGEARLPGLLGPMMWVTQSPPVLAVRVVKVRYDVVPEPPGSRGGTTDTELVTLGTYDLLLTDCDYKSSRQTHVVATPDGLYAFRDGDHVSLARDGVVLRDLPGAVDAAFAR